LGSPKLDASRRVKPTWGGGPLSKLWREESGLSLCLVILTVLLFVLYPLAGVGMANNLGVLVFALFLLSGIPAAGGLGSLVGRANAFIVAAWVGVELLIVFSPDYSLLILEACVTLAALLFLQGTILIQVFKPGRITAHRIRGAVATYLLLGLSWAWIYRLIVLLVPGAIVETSNPEQNLAMGTKLVYFSFMTLTTVGYGDIVPVGAFARSFSNLEALLGQLYPVVLIGRLVSLGGRQDQT
jgi:hypothetical protein